MWEEETSIRSKEISNFRLSLFYSMWHNFEGHMIELSKCFYSGYVKETITIIQFFNAMKLLLADLFSFSIKSFELFDIFSLNFLIVQFFFC